MLLSTLLTKVMRYIDENPVDTGCLILKLEAHKSDLPVEAYILTMDPRHIGTLRALLRNAFPRKLRKGQLKLSQNIHGAWRIDEDVTRT